MSFSDEELLELIRGGRSYREVAEILGVSRNTVGGRLNRLKKRKPKKTALNWMALFLAALPASRRDIAVPSHISSVAYRRGYVRVESAPLRDSCSSPKVIYHLTPLGLAYLTQHSTELDPPS